MAQGLNRAGLSRLTPPPPPAGEALSSREKAAIIVRLLLAEGAPIRLSALPDHMQAALTEQMASMRLVDRSTLAAVVGEFLHKLESVGLAFPGGIESAIALLEGHISSSAASRLRRLAGNSGRIDPWERLIPLPADKLLPVLSDESIEVAAVVLSKLPVARAADLLTRLPGERARRVTHAVSRTGNIDPETVRRIGAALVSQLDAQPPRAFDHGPVERVGAILNVTTASLRDELLDGLSSDDAEFADKVRRAIFTFTHIPTRILARDVPKITRVVEQPVLITALGGALAGPLAPVANWLLENMSPRLAQGLREEIEARGRIREKDAETAQSEVIDAIRRLDASGELQLVEPEEEG
ncbi:flagellar motor switch protein FliG [Falsigemmobacter intermedius]|uniref:flagellar motor switch protein FliG n=1 Tax=Falsigemmobacter intermedius TaxID=1553448 RepID=UPI003F0F3873